MFSSCQCWHYRQYFDDTLEELGTVANYAFGLGFHAQIGNKLYFYLTTAESTEAVFENNAFNNNLYCIDIEANTLSMLNTESKCLPGAIIASLDNYLVHRQSERSQDNQLSTYIELLDTTTGLIDRRSPVFVLDDNTNIGSYMMNVCTDGEYIYALIDERFADNTNAAYLYKYDNNLEIIQKISLDAVAEYILTARVGEMAVCGDCLYLKNYSRDAVIAVITDDRVIPLLQENNIQNAKQNSTEHETLFFSYGGNTIYFYSADKQKLTYQTLELEDDYLLKSIMEREGTLLITTFAYASSPTDIPEDRLLLVRRYE